MNKKIIALIIGVVALGSLVTFLSNKGGQQIAGAGTICFPFQGCTGTSTPPTTGQILVGQSNGSYQYANANSANGWLQLDSSGNAQGTWIQFLAASTSLSSIVLSRGQIGVASDTLATFIGNGTKAGGFPIGFWSGVASSTASSSITYTNGRVGIGVTSPDATLNVQTKTNGENVFDFQNTLNGGQLTLSGNGTLFANGDLTTGRGGLFEGISSGGGSFQVIDGPGGSTDLSITGDTDSGDLIWVLGNGSAGYANIEGTNDNRLIFGAGHIVISDTAPGTPTSCGSSPSIVGGSDNAFRFKAGGGVITACTIPFARSWTHAPVCDANTEGGLTVAVSASSTTSSVLITGASAITSDTITVQCVGY